MLKAGADTNFTNYREWIRQEMDEGRAKLKAEKLKARSERV